MRRVLVTGASGYVGRHLVRSLLDEGLSVRGFARGPGPACPPLLEWLQGDVGDRVGVREAMRGCDAVVHMACMPLGASWQDPVADFEVNATGTLNVLEAARAEGVRRLVYTSTAQVYGFADPPPMAEGAPVRPASPYAASKLCGEVLCASYARCHGLETVVLRLFNVYGRPVEGDLRSTVESLFLRRAAQGLPPTLRGNPEEARDFVHVAEVVRAIRLALDADCAGEVVNVGTGVLTTLLELARLVLEVAGSTGSPALEGPSGRAMRLQADVRKAKELLGFEARVTLRDGLAEMLTSVREPASPKDFPK